MKRMILIVALAAISSLHAQSIRMDARAFAAAAASYSKISPAAAALPEPTQSVNTGTLAPVTSAAMPESGIVKKDVDVSRADIVVQEDLIAGRKAGDLHFTHLFSGFITKLHQFSGAILHPERK